MREASEVDEILAQRIEVAQQRLNDQHRELDEKLVELKRGQKQRIVTLVAGIILAAIVAATAGHLVKAKLIDTRNMAHAEAWETLETKRDALRQAENWPELLNWTVSTHERFTAPENFERDRDRESAAEFYSEKRGQVLEDARNSVGNLLAITQAGNLPPDFNRARLAENLNAIRDWEVTPERLLLRALISMPQDRERNDPAAALKTWQDAVTLDPNFAKPLADELQATAELAWSDLKEDWTVDQPAKLSAAIADLPQTAHAECPRLGQIHQVLNADRIRRNGNPAEAMRKLLADLQTQPAWFSEATPYLDVLTSELTSQPIATVMEGAKALSAGFRAQTDWRIALGEDIVKMFQFLTGTRSQNPGLVLQLANHVAVENQELNQALEPSVSALFAQFEAGDPAVVVDSGAELIKAGDLWQNPRPFALLADLAPEQKRFDFYRRASELGDLDARAEVGRSYIAYAHENNSAEHFDQGFELLKDAAENDSQAAPLLLCNLYFQGDHVRPGEGERVPNPGLAVVWGERAVAAGHPRGKLALGRAQLLQAEQKKSRDHYEQAISSLREVSESFPEAWFALYQAYWNDTMALKASNSQEIDAQTAKNAADALQSGASKDEPNCLHMLGEWYNRGNPPIEQNVSIARVHYARAAKLGHAGARAWCQQYQAKIAREGSAKDKAWVQENQAAWK